MPTAKIVYHESAINKNYLTIGREEKSFILCIFRLSGFFDIISHLFIRLFIDIFGLMENVAFVLN